MTILNETLLHVINDEFPIFEEDIAIDATAIEGHSKPKKQQILKLAQPLTKET